MMAPVVGPLPGLRAKRRSGPIVWYLIDILAGFLNQGISRVLPFRRLDARPEIVWDLIGLGAAAAFTEAYYRLLEPGIEQALDGAVWIDRFREVFEVYPWWALVAFNLLATDFLAYWAHRLLHSGLLWPAHAWHHAPKYLYWMSGMRGSLLHVLLLFTPATVVWAFFPVPNMGHLLSVYMLLHIGNQHLIHSNIRLPFAATLEWVFVTPRFHFVHHSADLKRGNSNYGFILSVWDRLFGTYCDPASVPLDDPLGLAYEADNMRLLIGLPARPGSLWSRFRQPKRAVAKGPDTDGRAGVP